MRVLHLILSLLPVVFVTSANGEWWDTDGLVVSTIQQNKTVRTFCASGIPDSDGYVEFLPSSRMHLVSWLNTQTSLPPDTVPLAVIIKANQIATFPRRSQSVLFILEDHDPDIRSVQPGMDEDFSHAVLASKDFTALLKVASSTNASETTLDIFRDVKVSSRLNVFNVASFIIYGIALLSILLGSSMVIVSAEDLLDDMYKRYTAIRESKVAVYIALFVLLAVASGCLLLYYYLYDIAVYFAIALFFLVGWLAVTSVIGFWIMQCIPRTKKNLHAGFTLCRRPVRIGLSVVKLCVSPLSLALLIVWVIYRKNEFIGWHIQSVIGIFIIAWLLSSNIPLSSLKLLTVCFVMFLIYDVFFVFITPLFKSQNVTTPPPMETQLRSRRSASNDLSYMEAIATGSAGKSGELLPASFRVHIILPVGVYGCKHSPYSVLLGFGDALIPGLLCAFFAFYDTLWKIRFRMNFVASIFGYILGLLITQLVLSLTQRGQPALLYLCPSTLGTTVLVAAMFLGKEELRKMWMGVFPAAKANESRTPTSPGPDATEHPFEGVGKSTALLFPPECDSASGQRCDTVDVSAAPTA